MNKKTLRSIILVTGAFATGVITGMLISPGSGRENREWINQNAKEAGNRVNKKSREVVEQGGKKVQEFSGRVQKSVKDSMQDLSEAKEKLKT